MPYLMGGYHDLANGERGSAAAAAGADLIEWGSTPVPGDGPVIRSRHEALHGEHAARCVAVCERGRGAAVIMMVYVNVIAAAGGAFACAPPPRGPAYSDRPAPDEADEVRAACDDEGSPSCRWSRHHSGRIGQSSAGACRSTLSHRTTGSAPSSGGSADRAAVVPHRVSLAVASASRRRERGGAEVATRIGGSGWCARGEGGPEAVRSWSASGPWICDSRAQLPPREGQEKRLASQNGEQRGSHGVGVLWLVKTEAPNPRTPCAAHVRGCFLYCVNVRQSMLRCSTWSARAGGARGGKAALPPRAQRRASLRGEDRAPQDSGANRSAQS